MKEVEEIQDSLNKLRHRSNLFSTFFDHVERAVAEGTTHKNIVGMVNGAIEELKMQCLKL